VREPVHRSAPAGLVLEIDVGDQAARSEGVHGTSLTKSDDGVRTVAGQAANNASMEGELATYGEGQKKDRSRRPL
jgi:hypothetical protein